MGLFNRGRMRKAEALAVRIGENLLAQSVHDPALQGSAHVEVLARLARRVCEANAAWSVDAEGLLRSGRRGALRVPFASLHSALDLLGAVIDADLREHAQLPERDHDEVLRRALARLSAAVERRSLGEVSETLAPEREEEALFEGLAATGDDPDEIAAARAELEALAAGLLSAAYGALAFSQLFDESQVRPLTALRFFAARHPAWSIARGELRYRGHPVGSYASDDPVNSIYADMVFALLERDHADLSHASTRELALAAMRSWDRELAEHFLRARAEAPLETERAA